MNYEGRTFSYSEIPFGANLRDIDVALKYRLVRDSDGVVCGYFHREETAAEVVAALNQAAMVAA